MSARGYVQEAARARAALDAAERAEATADQIASAANQEAAEARRMAQRVEATAGHAANVAAQETAEARTAKEAVQKVEA